MASIPLDPGQVAHLKKLAEQIADQVQLFIDRHSTTSVERTVLRLYGVDGVDTTGTPIVNRVVEILNEEIGLSQGISRPFANALMSCGKGVQEAANLIANPARAAREPSLRGRGGETHLSGPFFRS